MMVTWQSDIPAAWIMVATPIFAERSVFVTTAYVRGCGLVQPTRSEPRSPASGSGALGVAQGGEVSQPVVRVLWGRSRSGTEPHTHLDFTLRNNRLL